VIVRITLGHVENFHIRQQTCDIVRQVRRLADWARSCRHALEGQLSREGIPRIPSFEALTSTTESPSETRRLARIWSRSGTAGLCLST